MKASEFMASRPVPAPPRMREIVAHVDQLAAADPDVLTLEQEKLLDLYRAYLEVVAMIVGSMRVEDLLDAAKALNQ